MSCYPINILQLTEDFSEPKHFTQEETEKCYFITIPFSKAQTLSLSLLAESGMESVKFFSRNFSNLYNLIFSNNWCKHQAFDKWILPLYKPFQFLGLHFYILYTHSPCTICTYVSREWQIWVCKWCAYKLREDGVICNTQPFSKI